MALVSVLLLISRRMFRTRCSRGSRRGSEGFYMQTLNEGIGGHFSQRYAFASSRTKDSRRLFRALIQTVIARASFCRPLMIAQEKSFNDDSSLLDSDKY